MPILWGTIFHRTSLSEFPEIAMHGVRKHLMVLLVAVLAMACASAAEESGRKLVKKVIPVYPQNAKQYQITGAVKLEVTVGADGSVRSTKVVAGHPLLTGAAVEAVSRWKYEAGAENVQTVVVNFGK